MIHRDTFTAGHLSEVAVRLKIRDAQHRGRMVHAFYLVEQLTLYGVDFTFKGGTCLSLIVNRLDRLSMDVDIEISNAVSYADIEASLIQIVSNGEVFLRWGQDVRPRDVEGSRHFKLFYRREGYLGDGGLEHILLEVVRATK